MTQGYKGQGFKDLERCPNCRALESIQAHAWGCPFDPLPLVSKQSTNTEAALAEEWF